MILIELQAHAVADQMPDADTDVLVFDGADEEGQLGAYVGEDHEGPQWVDAQGEAISGVTHWAEMPRLGKPKGTEAERLRAQIARACASYPADPVAAPTCVAVLRASLEPLPDIHTARS